MTPIFCSKLSTGMTFRYCYILFHINFYQLDQVIKTDWFDLQVIRGWLWKRHREPRWVVELAAGAGRTTPLTIPKRIVRVCDCTAPNSIVVTSVAEVVVPHYSSGVWPCITIAAVTEPHCLIVANLPHSIHKGPDMLPGILGSMCEGDSINVITL